MKPTFYAEDNPQLLLCGKNTWGAPCANAAVSADHIDNLYDRSASKHKKWFRRLQCPKYYYPAQLPITVPAGKLRKQNRGKGIFKLSDISNHKHANSRYLIACERDQWKDDDIKHLFQCCDDKLTDSKDEPKSIKMAHKHVDSKVAAPTMIKSVRSKCNPKWKIHSKSCDAAKTAYCSSVNTMNNKYCKPWYNEEHYPERIKLRQRVIKDHCDHNPHDNICTITKPKEPTKPSTITKPKEPTKSSTITKPKEPTKSSTITKPKEPTKSSTITGISPLSESTDIPRFDPDHDDSPGASPHQPMAIMGGNTTSIVDEKSPVLQPALILWILQQRILRPHQPIMDTTTTDITTDQPIMDTTTTDITTDQTHRGYYNNGYYD